MLSMSNPSLALVNEQLYIRSNRRRKEKKALHTGYQCLNFSLNIWRQSFLCIRWQQSGVITYMIHVRDSHMMRGQLCSQERSPMRYLTLPYHQSNVLRFQNWVELEAPAIEFQQQAHLSSPFSESEHLDYCHMIALPCSLGNGRKTTNVTFYLQRP